jgi:molybdate transport system substrate-binding protein
MKGNARDLLRGIAVIVAVAVVMFSGCGKEAEDKVVKAFCGAASKPAIEECSEAFEKQTGIRVEAQFGGSGIMLSRMKMSKMGDLFISGSPDYMINAERDEVIVPGSVKILAYMVPAIVVRKGNPKDIRSLEDLAKPGMRVAIGNPEAVCAGLYALEILEHTGLLSPVANNIVVHAESCAKIVALITMDRVDAVLGWRAFANWNPDETEAVMLSADEIPRLAYVPAGIFTYAENPELAQRFIDFLTSPDGQRIFTKWGYIATREAAQDFAPNATIGGEYELPEDYEPPVAGRSLESE